MRVPTSASCVLPQRREAGSTLAMPLTRSGAAGPSSVLPALDPTVRPRSGGPAAAPPSAAISALPLGYSEWVGRRSHRTPVPCRLMTQQPQDDDLDPHEAWARDRLTPLLGPLRRTDRRGGPPGLHDFEAELLDGSVAALEVTGEVDRKRLDLAASAERHLSSMRLPNSTFSWTVRLAAGARVRAIEPDKLFPLLSDMEASGRRRALDTGDPRDPVVAHLRALRIESVCAVPAKAGSEGKIRVLPGSYGGWGWGGPAIDEWLETFFASDQGVNKLRKLGRAAAAERHLSSCLTPSARQALAFP
jgi:hypothetical protein